MKTADERTNAIATVEPEESGMLHAEDLYAGDEPDEDGDAAPAKPAKVSRKQAAADKAAADKAREDERARVQAVVPWKLAEVPEWQVKQGGAVFAREEAQKLDQWADDNGTYPRVYRAYSRDEWMAAIATLAAAVAALPERDPAYQRRTGLYVEELGDDLILIRGKEWVLQILVPAKGSLKGKTFELKAAPGKDAWGQDKTRADQLADLLRNHLPDGARDTVLDLACQYLRDVRIRVNRGLWLDEHPEVAEVFASIKY